MPGSEWIGQIIRSARERQGMTQKELARRLGITPGCLSRVEKGYYSLGLDLFEIACKHLGIEISEDVELD